jgi:hypothetical protein
MRFLRAARELCCLALALLIVFGLDIKSVVADLTHQDVAQIFLDQIDLAIKIPIASDLDELVVLW